MQTKSKIALAAALLSSAALWGFAETSHAQDVNALTVASYNPSTGEMILTHSRGIVNFFLVSAPGSLGYSINLATYGPVDVSTADGFHSVSVDPNSNGTPQYSLSVPIDTQVTGFVNSSPFSFTNTTSVSLRYFGFDNSATSIQRDGTSPYISDARGFLYSFNGTKPFPNGFTFVPPSPPTPTLSPTVTPTPPTVTPTPPTVTPPPSSINVPELNAARLTLPEPTTQPGNLAAQNNPAANAAPGGQNLRPNGIHTRIIPEWSPGLYQ